MKLWMLPIGLLLLAGCSTQPSSNAAPSPGCEVQRLEDAEQAVEQLRGHSQAYVFKIDGDLATCKFEILYRADEEAKVLEPIAYIGSKGEDFQRSAEVRATPGISANRQGM